MTRLSTLAVAVVAGLLAVGAPSLPARAGPTSRGVLLPASPPLARAPRAAARIDAEQRAFRHELAAEVPSARVGWRYRLVANGFSVTLPKSDVARVRGLRGVRDVLPTASYA